MFGIVWGEWKFQGDRFQVKGRIFSHAESLSDRLAAWEGSELWGSDAGPEAASTWTAAGQGRREWSGEGPAQSVPSKLS